MIVVSVTANETNSTDSCYCSNVWTAILCVRALILEYISIVPYVAIALCLVLIMIVNMIVCLFIPPPVPKIDTTASKGKKMTETTTTESDADLTKRGKFRTSLIWMVKALMAILRFIFLCTFFTLYALFLRPFFSVAPDIF